MSVFLLVLFQSFCVFFFCFVLYSLFRFGFAAVSFNVGVDASKNRIDFFFFSLLPSLSLSHITLISHTNNIDSSRFIVAIK